MASDVMKIALEAEFDAAKTSKAFKKIASDFESNTNNALARAISTVIKPSAWKKQAEVMAKIKAKVAAAGDDKAAKARVVSMEKAYKKEFGWIDKVTKRRAKAIKELGGKPGDLFSTATVQKFGESLGNSFNDVMSGNLSTYAKLIGKISEGTKKTGFADQAK